ncbi:hypothetical protein SAMD00019534_067320 [Acytostelium subglobosum LB1]|uniref:hypothetical protein n=1 Tax=Acytostelium subglobosum LB1 TaxID=1410327 RepID=UPI000644845A|nr:hypothetical protein SAMD00019534_067320 [Acytostelium subglobosum LB1]GAM23557.1 hypothetical protein SAMD00019534_067320 [Acytostelium subglobosum LB1]|eukprot:XP_012753298.1 hypothetical protein SAMD00019534_067320 [Acytostelium subglobosum LB1]
MMITTQSSSNNRYYSTSTNPTPSPSSSSSTSESTSSNDKKPIPTRDMDQQQLRTELFNQFEETVLTTLNQQHLDEIPMIAAKPQPWDDRVYLGFISSSPFLSFIYPETLITQLSRPLVTMQNWYNYLRAKRSPWKELFEDSQQGDIVAATSKQLLTFIELLSNYQGAKDNEAIKSMVTDYYYEKTVGPLLGHMDEFLRLEHPPHFKFKVEEITQATKTKLQVLRGRMFVSVHYHIKGKYGVNDYVFEQSKRQITGAIWSAPVPTKEQPMVQWQLAFMCPSASALYAVETVIPPLHYIGVDAKLNEAAVINNQLKANTNVDSQSNTTTTTSSS